MIPAGTTFVSSSFAGYDPTTGQVNLGTLAPGATVSGTLVVSVPEEDATVTNTATVQSDLPDQPGGQHEYGPGRRRRPIGDCYRRLHRDWI